ncbi:MAG: hypothetical protein B9S32_14360 [Verrucomicrobia bacterium Tous-C9LFEB]|nr:MAG: hypothetical protein B9S32_14360 [Verrucomicrobia bacterium Tous-C9LFEB]
MSAKLDALARHRAELVAKSDRQRQELAYHFAQVERPLHLADTGIRLVRTIRSHPILISAIAAIVGKVFAGRLGFIQRLGVWPARLMTAWQLFTRVRSAFTQPRQG